MGDQFRQTFQINGIALVGTVYNGKPMVMCTVTDDLISEIKAGKVVKEIGTMMGGGGGGKDHLATAGGTDASHLNDILDKGREYIKSLLK
jgi:alanyl-tRNA synthetase